MRYSGVVGHRRLGVLVAVAALALSICTAAPTAAAPAQTSGASISGTVTDASGSPLAGVTVQLYINSQPDTFGTTTTAADGTYTISGVPIGNSQGQVGFSDPGYVPQWWNNKPSLATADLVTLTQGQTTAGIDAVLQPETTTGDITGNVTDASTHAAVADASVTATNTSTGQSTTTSSNNAGAYMFIALSPGTYTVGFTAVNYLDQWWNDKPSQATADPVTVTGGQIASGINAALAPDLVGVSGTVTDNTGKPVAGATVSVVSQVVSFGSTTTAADGTYTITFLSPGPPPPGAGPFVEFTAPGYVTQFWNDKPTEATADAVPLTDGQTTTGINAVLQPATISGVVQSSTGANPAPLAGATVVVDNVFGFPVTQTTTASDGTWSVTNPGGGVYRVEFQPPTGSGLLSQWWNNKPDLAHSDGLAVPAGANVGNINATLTPGSTISGTVTDTAGPVAGATVGVFTVDSSNAPATEIAHATTAADGTYSLAGLQAANYDVLFDPPAGSADVGQWFSNSPTAGGASEVTVSSTGSTTADAQLTTGQRGSISGTVTDRNGTLAVHPIAGATVEAVAADGTTTATATTAADGTYTIANLNVGIYTVWFLPPAGSNYRASVWNAVVGKVLPITVDQGSNVTGIIGRLTQNGSVAGTVTGPSGPVAGATVLVTNYYGFGEATATTAADGTYTVTGVSPGSSRVEFTASGFVTQWWDNKPDLAHSNTIGVPNNGTATANATLVASGG